MEFSVGSKQAVWEIKDPLLGPADVDVVASSNTHDSYGRASGARLTPNSASKSSGGLNYPPGGHYGGY